MRLEDMVMISVDDHIVEPPSIFKHHLADKYKDRAPRVVRNDETEKDDWHFNGQTIMNSQMNSVVGRPAEELGWEPTAYDQIRAGCYDVKARIGDMNVNGLAASLNFPTFPGFALELFTKDTKDDRELGLALVRAYNDWHIHEWAAEGPGRLIPMCGVPLWSPKLAAEEVRRVAKLGVRNITFPANPVTVGLPNIHDKGWKPFWDAIEDEGMLLNMHCGGGGGSEYIAPDSPVETMLTKRGLSSMTALSEWLWSDMMREYSNLNILLSEGDAGWIPYILERAELVLDRHGPWTGQRERFTKSPTEIFRERFYCCFIEDVFAMQNIEMIGEDRLCYETDYPHADVTWPIGPECLLRDAEKANLTDAQIDKITHQNAAKALQFDPIEILGRENVTVGALRNAGRDVDMSPVGKNRGIPPSERWGHVVTAGDVARQHGKLGVRTWDVGQFEEA
ncbi:amidohydrolase family protein [Sphingopyxis flava]|uniref:Predicted metal-dependent hydrolase, TIM-barrel fold n=1 Tax=Sphingopyxis flava TaxID=1507287 RepID=A0A1T5FM20_9SPHN|nr:amidohydrolase family protein [Sphingopyxis flava]SKB97137.1 Predicted metal-dependent hydrolase, TIM-barrel fold [Sphingopyxis flava]